MFCTGNDKNLKSVEIKQAETAAMAGKIQFRVEAIVKITHIRCLNSDRLWYPDLRDSS